MTAALWYVGRGSGVISLLLLTVVMVLGIGSRSARPAFGLPRFGVVALHRAASLLSVVFLALHVVTLSLDPQAELRLVDLVLPFDAAYRPLWMGLGTVGLDLMVAIVVTSLLRHRLGRRAWRAVHWLAYLSWPVAVAHTVGTGTDRATWWLLGLTLACVGRGRRGTRVAGRRGVRPPPPVPAPDPTGRRPGTGPTARGRAMSVAVGVSEAAAADGAGSSERLLAALAPDRSTHLARVGPLPLQSSAALLAAVRSSGLTGHGGAAFPTWRKLEAVAAGRNPVVVGNGAEGEPASRKDKLLLEHAPHLVLDGLQVAAATVGSRSVYLYLPAAVQQPVRRALAERSDPVPVRLVTAAESFVAGQETAVVAAVEGARPVPRDAPDLVVRKGVRGRATLVQNVETLAHLALVARRGGEWFRGVGTAAQPGTFLATVSGAVPRPGVVEAAYGVPLGELIARAGGATEPVQAVLVGGYHGVWLPAGALDAPMSA